MKPISNKVDQRMFDAIKILLESGQSAPQIGEYLKISQCTIYRIKQCESFQEYKNIMAAMSAKRTAQKNAKKQDKTEAPAVKEEPEQQPTQVVEHRQSVTIQTTYYVSQKLDAITELLKGISAKLAFVVDELTGVKPAKKEEM